MFKIAVIPGDGIGTEVIGEGLKVLRALEETHDFRADFSEIDLGAARYLRSGELITDDDIDFIRKHDAIYFGAIGDPRVEPGVLEKGILLRMRTVFDQFVNYRPVRAWHPFTPLKKESDFNIHFLRENTEDMYMGIGGIFSREAREVEASIERSLYRMKLELKCHTTSEDDFAFEVGLMSRAGIERFADFVFNFASAHGEKRITVVDKANVCKSLYGLWREVFSEKTADWGIDVNFMFVDAMAMAIVRRPEDFGVVAAPNMFGDILTDLGAEIQGGLGLSASGNINPDGVSMFEPVHGSAPDIAGKGIANPFGALLAAKMMLDHLGRIDLGEKIEGGIKWAIEHKILTPDMGGSSKTSEVGDAVVDYICRR